MATVSRAGSFAVALSAVLALAVAADAASTSVVSASPSPYDTPGCHAVDASQTAQFSGILNYLGSEVEPQVAVDPTDGNHLIGVWQQDRWSDGGAHGLVSAYSTDGGAGWTVVPQPFSACYGASGYGSSLGYQRASDPWVSIGPGKPGSSCAPTTPGCSTAYSVSISFDETDANNAVAAAVSYDGGATWTHLTTLIQDPCRGVRQPGYSCNPKAFVFDDKESVTADPTRPGSAYAVWDRLTAPPASPPGFFHELAYKGPAWISRTTDYGQTWSTPQRIVSTPSIDQTIGNVIVVDPTSGTLYDFFTYVQNVANKGGNRGLSIGFVKSTDHGVSWSKPKTVAAEPTVGVADPVNVEPSTDAPPAELRVGGGLPEPAVSSTGQLYVVWEGLDSATGTDQVYITTSTDGGATWSSPALVNTDTSRPAYTPAVAVAPDGTVGVTYYQWDATPTVGAEPTALFIQKSTSRGSSGLAPTFGRPTAVSAEFNGLAAPWAGGYFLGDYEGLAANASGFVPFDVLTNCDDGGGGTQPGCRALSSVVSPADLTPTDANATDVYAAPGS